MRTPAEDLIAKWRKRERHDQRSGRSAIEARTWKQAADELEALLTAAVPQSSPMLAEAQRARAERAEAALRAYGQHKPECHKLRNDNFAQAGIKRSLDPDVCTCDFEKTIQAVLGSPRTEQVP